MTNLEIDEMWKNILEKKDFNDESSFPNLKEFMNLREIMPLCHFHILMPKQKEYFLLSLTSRIKREIVLMSLV